MWIGVFLIVAGLLLAVAPLQMARGSAALRYVPYSTRSGLVRWYRLSGGVIALAGLVIALVWH